MIRLQANVSKKVPIPGLEYSSRSFSAGMEVEVGEGASAQMIAARLREVYALLEGSVDTEIARDQRLPVPTGGLNTPEPDYTPPASHGNGNGGNGGRLRKATQAQVKAIFAIGKSMGLDRAAILEQVARFGAPAPEELTLRNASELIQTLRNENQPA